MDGAANKKRKLRTTDTEADAADVAARLTRALKQGKAGGGEVAQLCTALVGDEKGSLASVTAALAVASREATKQHKKACTEPVPTLSMDGATLCGVHLPPGAIARIFAALSWRDKAALAVCDKTFEQASRYPGGWVSSHALTLPKSECRQNPTAVLSFLQRNKDRFAQVTGIRLNCVSSSFKPGAKFFKGLLECMPSLRSFDSLAMIGSPANDQYIELVGQHLGAKLRVFHSGGIHVSTDAMHSLAKHCKALEVLEMTPPYAHKHSIMHRETYSRKNVAGCPRLQHLVFPDRDAVNHRAVSVVDVAVLRAGQAYAEEGMDKPAAYVPIKALLASWAQEETTANHYLS